MNHDQQYSIFKLIRSISTDCDEGKKKNRETNYALILRLNIFPTGRKIWQNVYKRGATYPR